MKLTLADAATRADVSKSTLLRAIKRGELSAERHGERAFMVDGSELGRWQSSRVIAAPPEEPAPVVAHPAAADGPSDADLELTHLRGLVAQRDAEVTLLREQLADARATIADLRDTRDQDRAAHMAALDRIPRQIAPPVEASRVETQPAGRLAWWRRG